ncbi:hypothetical protein [Cribrihabitans pelagius]|uniref:hypothetical protein n=1 Tax=Cribrihabitans pelagius TaxID=1765746 RepID=UPI003B5B6A52
MPASGAESWRGCILPVIVLSGYAIPRLMRSTRSGVIGVPAGGCIPAARAKGLPKRW